MLSSSTGPRGELEGLQQQNESAKQISHSHNTSNLLAYMIMIIYYIVVVVVILANKQ